MVDIVEAPLDVTLNKPLGSGAVASGVSKGGVASTLGSESVTVIGELGLIVRFQQEAYHFLQQFIRPGRNT